MIKECWNFNFLFDPDYVMQAPPHHVDKKRRYSNEGPANRRAANSSTKMLGISSKSKSYMASGKGTMKGGLVCW